MSAATVQGVRIVALGIYDDLSEAEGAAGDLIGGTITAVRGGYEVTYAVLAPITVGTQVRDLSKPNRPQTASVISIDRDHRLFLTTGRIVHRDRVLVLN